jgi:6-phosphogluconolactonase (cycloisomerase 2 family)
MDNTISMYTIDASSGNLLPNSPATISAGSEPWRDVVDPSGKFVYVVDENDATVSIFTINSNGSTLNANGAATTGSTPFAVAVTASSQ